MLIIDYLMEFEGKKQQIKKQYKMALCLQLGVKLYHFISLSLCCGQNKNGCESTYTRHTHPYDQIHGRLGGRDSQSYEDKAIFVFVS